MSKLTKISLVLFLSLVGVANQTRVFAKTLNFHNQAWVIQPKVVAEVPAVFVKNDFDLVKISKNIVLGQTNATPAPIFDDQTLGTLADINNKIYQQPKDAKLVLLENKAVEFEPGEDGVSIDLFTLTQNLNQDQERMDLPVIPSSAKVNLADTNELGIRELAAVGESDFFGSPANRIHNIVVGADKFNGLILSPNEEFSFNKFLGDVDDQHGFLPELVIKRGGVVPEFGGGLCQVSTTTFRAAMNAGFPITKRRNHSLAVKYYAPQGTDATIYPGSSDLKFINNLPSHLLIRTLVKKNHLYFEFYGTKDDRTVTFDGPIQYDKKPDGSLKATWTRIVTLNGQSTAQTFKSAYLPPELFKTVLAPATPNPDAVTNPSPPTANQ